MFYTYESQSCIKRVVYVALREYFSKLSRTSIYTEREDNINCYNFICHASVMYFTIDDETSATILKDFPSRNQDFIKLSILFLRFLTHEPVNFLYRGMYILNEAILIEVILKIKEKVFI